MADKDDLLDSLKAFFGRATSEAEGSFMPEGMRQTGAPTTRRRSLRQIYEDCVAELSDDERNALDRLIREMERRRGLSAAFRHPQRRF
jgi:hypothetical protein